MLKGSDSTSASFVNVLGCNMMSTARTQGTLALSFGEEELYAIGQDVSEALCRRSMLLEARLANAEWHLLMTGQRLAWSHKGMSA